MRRLLALLLLCPLMAAAQGLSTAPPPWTGPGMTGGNPSGGGKVLASFPFSTTGCLATGTGGVNITRATKGTVNANGDGYTLTECQNNEYRVSPDGLLVEPARTNVALASNTISAANAFNVAWVAWPDETVVDVTTAAAATQGGTWHTITNEAGGGNNTGQAYQTVTTASSTTFAASVWMKKPVAEDTTHAGIHVGCGAGTPSACTCSRSDGGSCTASTVATNYCQALVADLAQTAVRVTAKVTCSGAITSSIVALVPGNYGSTIGITDFTGVQHEIGTFPTSNILVAATAVARNADVVSATVPAVTGGKYCLAASETPVPGRTMLDQAVWGLGIAGAAGSTWGNTTAFYTRDATAGTRNFTSSSTPSLAAHRYVWCNNAGVLTMGLDGASFAGSYSGAGTGLILSTPTTIYFGQVSSGFQNGNSIKNLKICKAKNAKECK